MSKKNLIRLKTKKGFTMVELLAVIVILGILTTISIVAIQGLMAKGRENYYKSQEGSMVASARNYAEKNKQYLPKVNGQTTYIYLKDLTKSKYIDKVLDYKKNNCDENSSFIQIFYYDNEYYYTPYLKCTDWSSPEVTDAQNFTITITYSGGINDAKAKITLSENDNGIASYNYKIYADTKLQFTSEQFDMHKAKTTSKNIELSQYTPANIKIVVTGVSAKGLSKTESKPHDYSDSGDGGKPSCGTDIQGASTTWTTSNRTISINCVDGTNGVGCARDRFTKEFTESVQEDNIKIQDKNGNSRNCPVNVYIDKDYPTVTLKAYKRNSSGGKANNTVLKQVTAKNGNPTPTLEVSTAWLNKDNYPNGVYLEATYSDLSGIKKIDWEWNTSGLPSNSSNVNTLTSSSNIVPTGTDVNSGTYTNYLSADGYRVAKLSMTDKVDHVSAITIKVPIDKTAPTCTNSSTPTSWAKGSREITTTFSDTVSGLKTASPGKVNYTSTIDTKTYNMEDNAGNKANCSVKVLLDNTAPSNLSVNYYKWKDDSTRPSNNSGLTKYTSGWTDKKIYATASGATDSESGGVYYQYKTTGATGTNTDKNGSSYNVEVQGVSNVAFRACDSLGNCTSYSNKQLNIEWYVKPPSIRGGVGGWGVAYRIIWLNAAAEAPSDISNYQFCIKGDNSSNGCSWQNLYNNTAGAPSGVDIAFYHANNGDLINAFGGDVGLLEIHWNNNGRYEGRAASNSNWTRTAQNISNQGDHYVFFRAKSKAGHYSDASNSQRVMIDRTCPQYRFDVICGSGDPWGHPNHNFHANIYYWDTYSGVAGRKIEWGDSKYGSLHFSQGYDDGAFDEDLVSSEGDWQDFRIHICDNIGNCCDYYNVNQASSCR